MFSNLFIYTFLLCNLKVWGNALDFFYKEDFTENQQKSSSNLIYVILDILPLLKRVSQHIISIMMYKYTYV